MMMVVVVMMMMVMMMVMIIIIIIILLVVVVKVLTCIREVPGSNFISGYLFYGFKTSVLLT